MGDKVDDWVMKIFNIIKTNFIIQRSSKFYNCWNIFITASCLSSCYMYSYIAAFGHTNDIQTYIFEGIFIFDMLITVLTELPPLDNSDLPERRLQVIAERYLKTQFLWDLIPLVPFQLIKIPYTDQGIFYIFKITRIKRGFKLFNVHSMMQVVKAFFHKRLLMIIKNNETLANDFS